ncbi:signal peptidase I [Paenibacillus sp. MMS18-CY102]|uniref:signal peptidase I n=1 Tax=Paenibacillus sp. MMS18-CY102 TaxID=2682849 RepID=UPI0013666563|nr:signal peptidase I [Paenibacillus sp. MMS18-CY102]MWC28639.1 signal peptidase I [Paenibacillus sp. MMS18-CY102]
MNDNNPIKDRITGKPLKNKTYTRVKWVGLGTLLLLLVFFVPQLSYVMNIWGSGSTTITDSITKESLGEATLTSDLFEVNPMYDNMNRGHNELVNHAVIDPNYYKTNPIRRGDIIYFHGQAFDPRLREGDISRVIGLPGESIKVHKGQIYVNEKKLNTFYGQAHRGGMTREAFLQLPDSHNINKEVILKDVYDFSLKSVTVPDGTIFIVGDDWLRSLDSLHLGPLPQRLITGKVVGE